MSSQVWNPFLPLDEYIADGEPHVFGDRVYLVGSHDKEAGDTFCMLDYVGWSAPVDDLSNWKCSGTIYSAKQDPLYDSESMAYLYAPDVVRGNDGRYYLYYCLSGRMGKGGYSNPISVAVCDTPDGSYEYLGVVKNPDGTPLRRYVCFDPAVLNDGGTIRLYYGTYLPHLDKILGKRFRDMIQGDLFGRTREEMQAVPEGVMGAYHVTLADDMLTATSNPVRIDDTIEGKAYKKHLFFEGSSIRRIGKTYYFIYSSVNNHELCYATSPYPDRGFQYRGTIVSNGDIGYQGRKPKDRLNHTGTNHGSIECIHGQWYVFYHRLTHQSDYSRQACAERIQILPDGSIPQVETTSCGLNGGPLAGKGTYPAVICCNLTNGKMQHGTNQKKGYDAPMVTSRNEERFIGNIGNHTFIGYKYFDLSGDFTLALSIRGEFQGSLQILETIGGTPVAEIAITPAAKWQIFSGKVHGKQGEFPIYFYFKGTGKAELLEFSLLQ